MIPIEIINRTGGGRRDVFVESPVTFGRDASNMVIVAGEFVSRRHGELRFDGDQWSIHAQSANGALVNGKRVGKRGRKLRDQDVVSVGDDVLFEVRIEPPVAPVAELLEPDEDDDDAAPDQPKSKRKGVWIGIGVYLLAMLGVFMYLSTLKSADGDGIRLAPELTKEQIRDDMLRPIDAADPDEHLAADHLEQAREAYHRLGASDREAYLAYHHYRMAMARLPDNRLPDSADDLRYHEARQRLMDAVTDTYQRAYEMLRSRRYREAAETFRHLTELYPQPQSVIHQNADAHRTTAVRLYSKEPRRRRR
jgi:hypothetical protein